MKIVSVSQDYTDIQTFGVGGKTMINVMIGWSSQ